MKCFRTVATCLFLLTYPWWMSKSKTVVTLQRAGLKWSYLCYNIFKINFRWNVWIFKCQDDHCWLWYLVYLPYTIWTHLQYLLFSKIVHIVIKNDPFCVTEIIVWFDFRQQAICFNFHVVKHDWLSSRFGMDKNWISTKSNDISPLNVSHFSLKIFAHFNEVTAFTSGSCKEPFWRFCFPF